MTGVKLTLKFKTREPKYFKNPFENNKLNMTRSFFSVCNATHFFFISDDTKLIFNSLQCQPVLLKYILCLATCFDLREPSSDNTF
jgi:inosine/xanthosine triphosphate pyrophosphatase family protein